jgi:hypothetical protein
MAALWLSHVCPSGLATVVPMGTACSSQHLWLFLRVQETPSAHIPSWPECWTMELPRNCPHPVTDSAPAPSPTSDNQAGVVHWPLEYPRWLTPPTPIHTDGVTYLQHWVFCCCWVWDFQLARQALYHLSHTSNLSLCHCFSHAQPAPLHLAFRFIILKWGIIHQLYRNMSEKLKHFLIYRYVPM